MTSASEIEKRFRNKPELFTLKKHEAAKSDYCNVTSNLRTIITTRSLMYFVRYKCGSGRVGSPT